MKQTLRLQSGGRKAGVVRGWRRVENFFDEMGRKYLEISEICCNFASLLGSENVVKTVLGTKRFLSGRWINDVTLSVQPEAGT